MNFKIFALFIAGAAAQTCNTAISAQTSSTKVDGSCQIGYVCQYSFGVPASTIVGLASNVPTLTTSCVALAGPGNPCSTDSQCGTTYRPPTYSSTGTVSWGDYKDMTSVCKGGYCCKSSSCTTTCDSYGNCMGDTCTAIPTTGSLSAVYGTGVAAGSTGVSLTNMCYYTTQPSLPLASSTIGSIITANYGNTLTCKPNSYGNSYANPTSCISCPSGQVTLYPGATSSSDCKCPAGTYTDTVGANNIAYQCTACPAGSTSSIGATSLAQCNIFTASQATQTIHTNLKAAILAFLVLGSAVYVVSLVTSFICSRLAHKKTLTSTPPATATATA